MSKKDIKRIFLNKIELFYRNFGNEWTLDDFVVNKSQKEYLENFLFILQEKGIVKINEEKKTFTILDLPSNYENLVP